MEPLIKSEPCEDLYREHDKQQFGSEQHHNNAQLERVTESQKDLKRLYQEINISEEYSNHLTEHPQNESFNSQITIGLEAQPTKRRKLEENVLFNPPFFKLIDEMPSATNKDAIAARCYSCHKIVKGNIGITSNFIKHMKRGHPEINKMYESFKSLKMKIGLLPNRLQIPRECVSTNENSSTNLVFRRDSLAEDDTSDENEEIVETNESSKESPQPQLVLNQEIATVELSANTLEAIGNIIDEKLKNFVKLKDYELLNDKVKILLKENGTNSEKSNPSLLELKTEMENLKKECSLLRLAVQKSQASRLQLQNELQTVEKLLHQRKLIIRNIPVYNPEESRKSVEKLLKERLNLNDIKILNCSIIPSAKTSSMESHKETLSIELENPQACKLILRETHKLKNTGIFIETEISTFQRKRKNKLMVLRKELLKRKSDLKVLVRDTTLVVNGKKFYWDDVEGLCHDGKEEEALEMNGVEYLENVSGLDLREFINVLQSYNVQIS
ncbi:uncharacterized protein ACRADG_008331 [Cochliomyia hominivorax]